MSWVNTLVAFFWQLPLLADDFGWGGPPHGEGLRDKFSDPAKEPTARDIAGELLSSHGWLLFWLAVLCAVVVCLLLIPRHRRRTAAVSSPGRWRSRTG